MGRVHHAGVRAAALVAVPAAPAAAAADPPGQEVADDSRPGLAVDEERGAATRAQAPEAPPGRDVRAEPVAVDDAPEPEDPAGGGGRDVDAPGTHRGAVTMPAPARNVPEERAPAAPSRDVSPQPAERPGAGLAEVPVAAAQAGSSTARVPPVIAGEISGQRQDVPLQVRLAGVLVAVAALLLGRLVFERVRSR